MQNKFPAWKNALLVVIMILGFLYAAPNFYGEDPSVQVSAATRVVQIDQQVVDKIQSVLQKQNLKYKSVQLEEDDVLVRFFNTDTQLQARDYIKHALGEQYAVAVTLTPATPAWLEAFNASPMKLGLDLSGGVHFLLDVDVEGVVTAREQGLVRSISEDLRNARIRYASITSVKAKGIFMRFRSIADRDDAYNLIRKEEPQLLLSKTSTNGNYSLLAKLSPAALSEVRQYTIEQTMTTLRKRVNELGVSEPIVQQQGSNRVAVDLPGVQDATRAQSIIGGTATVKFFLKDTIHDASAAMATGVIPVGSKLYNFEGRPVLLKNQLILSGESITSAMASFSQAGTPSVNIRLGGGGESLFTRVTRANIGKPMATVFVETKTENKIVDGKMQRVHRKVERIINIATIQDALGSSFQVTGLGDPKESSNLALLLRAGALPAPMSIIESRIVGPSLGLENIKRGMISLEVGMAIIVIFMALYYRTFGLIADFALLLNLVLLVAVLSMIGATLTLPGIAGIVLTVGMAVDANVLIYERIREEMRNGVPTQTAIYSGYEKAFSTIVDANVTTLIVAFVLFAIGSGPIKGFAITLSIGLLTSMLTGITYTRAVVNWIYGGKKDKKLSIGIKMPVSN